jgi:hypothetical protein
VEVDDVCLLPSKCSYIIFSADKSNKESSKIELKLFQTTIPMCDNPTFLGIRFDTFHSKIN